VQTRAFGTSCPDILHHHDPKTLLHPQNSRKIDVSGVNDYVFRDLAGEDRYFIYSMAMQTGLRAGEFASLKASSFDLSGDPPVVRVDAAYSKRRREDIQPIPAELADALVNYLATKPAEGLIWPGTWSRVAAKMIARDLAAAGIKQETEAGTVDFHATRHSYITLLTKGGVHPKMAQSLARHSTITLTMDYYTHVGLFDQATALEALPSFLSGATGTSAEAVRRTGTDGAPGPRLDQTDEVSCNSMITPKNPGQKGPTGRRGAERQDGMAVALDCDHLIAGEKRVGDRTRTGDNQIHSLASGRRKDIQDNTSSEEGTGRERALTKEAGPAVEIDVVLARVIEAWPKLSEPIRAAILALVKTAHF